MPKGGTRGKGTRCVFKHYKKAGKMKVGWRKAGQSCSPSAATVKRLSKKFGCTDVSHCPAHKAHHKATRADRSRRMLAMRERRMRRL
jgi:DNA-binding MurR/RpiR family transcriptional regulator